MGNNWFGHPKVFQGKLTYTTKCSRDHSINQETNPFWTLPLSLRDGTPEDDDTYSVVGSHHSNVASTCCLTPKTKSFVSVCLIRKQTLRGFLTKAISEETTWCSAKHVERKQRRTAWVEPEDKLTRWVWWAKHAASAHDSCVVQECQMEESPQILTLLLKRFDFDYRTMSHVKSQRCVGVPPVLHTEVSTFKILSCVLFFPHISQ